MPDSPEEDADSRTASVGVQRARSNARSAASSRHGSHDSINLRPTKKQRRHGPGDRDVNDFVPRGASFSANSLQVDPESTSSSGSTSGSGSSENDSDSVAAEDSEKREDPAPTANPHVGSKAPAISWNQGRKTAVRTSLGKRPAQPDGSASAAEFNTVDGKFSRSRSASATSEESDVAMEDGSQSDDGLEDGEIEAGSDSEDSVSLDSEADDSLMLNIGTRDPKTASADGADDHDPESLVAKSYTNGEKSAPLMQSDAAQSAPKSKEEAFQEHSHKYPTAPTTLMDLNQSDLVTQARYLFFDRDINDLDLSLPITCVECLRDGHLAEVCPTREVCLPTFWCPHASIDNWYLVCALWCMEPTPKHSVPQVAKVSAVPKTGPRRAAMCFASEELSLRDSV